MTEREAQDGRVGAQAPGVVDVRERPIRGRFASELELDGAVHGPDLALRPRPRFPCEKFNRHLRPHCPFDHPGAGEGGNKQREPDDRMHASRVRIPVEGMEQDDDPSESVEALVEGMFDVTREVTIDVED